MRNFKLRIPLKRMILFDIEYYALFIKKTNVKNKMDIKKLQRMFLIGRLGNCTPCICEYIRGVISFQCILSAWSDTQRAMKRVGNLAQAKTKNP